MSEINAGASCLFTSIRIIYRITPALTAREPTLSKELILVFQLLPNVNTLV